MVAATRAASRRSSLDRAQRAWVAVLARAGLVAVGVSYALVGVLALALAFGVAGAEEDREGALDRVASTGWGVPLLLAVAAGFGAYAAWRAVRALIGENVEGAEDREWPKRGVDAVRALFYGGLTVVTLRLLGAGTSKQDESSKAATVMDWPGGRLLVAAVGLGLVAAAVWNGYRAISKKYEDQLKTWQISRSQKKAIHAVAHYGLIARVVVFGIMGWFALRSAIEYDPKKAIGLDGALRVLAQQPYGRVLLGIVAIGLLAYALFRLVEARFRKV